MVEEIGIFTWNQIFLGKFILLRGMSCTPLKMERIKTLILDVIKSEFYGYKSYWISLRQTPSKIHSYIHVSDQHAVTGPLKVSADAQHANAVWWPVKKPFADRPFFAICWPAIVVFLLYADRPCKSQWLYILCTFIFGRVFAVRWPTNIFDF